RRSRTGRARGTACTGRESASFFRRRWGLPRPRTGASAAPSSGAVKHKAGLVARLDIGATFHLPAAAARRRIRRMSGIFRIDDPYRGDVVAERKLLTAGEVEAVVARAARAQHAWARTAVGDRVALCERFCAAFEQDGERIAAEITRQMGKPLQQARGEVKTRSEEHTSELQSHLKLVCRLALE